MATLLERLYVEITADTEKMQKELLSASRRVQSFGKELRDVGRGLTLGLTVPLTAVGVAAIKMASDAEEAANKFDVVFGRAAAGARQELEGLTETIPLTLAEMQGLSAGIQDLLVPLGLAREEAAKLSVRAVELAGDLGSFNNVSAAEALNDIKSALIGASEPISKYGVDTREAALQARALAEGLIVEGQALDRTTRALAVFAQIQAQSTDALGDAARTVDSTANSFKFLARDIKQLGVDIGEILIPVIRPVVSLVLDVVQAIGAWSTETKTLVIVLGGFAAAIGPLVLLAGSLVAAFGALLPVVTALGGILVPGGAVLVGLVGLAAAFIAVRNDGEDAKRAVEEFASGLRGATRDVLLHAQAVETIRYFDLLDEATALEQKAKDLGAAFKEIDRLRLNEITLDGGLLDQSIRRSVALADELARAGEGAGTITRELRDTAAEAERAKKRAEAIEEVRRNASRQFNQFRRETLELAERVLAAENLTVRAIRAQGAALRENAALRETASATADEFERSLEALEAAKAALQEMVRQDLEKVATSLENIFSSIGEAFDGIGRAVAGLLNEFIDLRAVIKDNGKAGLEVGVNPLAGIGGLFAASINAIAESAAAAARRIEEARRAYERALDDYVDELADLNRFERLRVDAVEGAREFVQAFFDQVTAGIKNDRVRNEIAAQFDEAIASLDLDALRKLLTEIGGSDATRVLAELERRLKAINEARLEEIQALSQSLAVRALRARGLDDEAAQLQLAIKYQEELARAAELGDASLIALVNEVYNLERAAIEAAAAERRLADARRAAAFGANLAADVLAARGDDRGAFVAQQEIKRDNTIAEARRLFEEGLISEAAFTRIVALANEIFASAVDAFDAEARRAAEAMLELARAAEFQAQQDLRNLNVRLLVAQGLDDEAFAMRQQIELLQALQDGRSAEYIALLQQVQAAERAARSREDEAKAARETEAAINGVTRALNAPKGLRLSLLRFQALGAGTPGVQQLPPSRFIGQQSADTAGPASISVSGGINVFSSGPDESGEDLLAKIEQAVVRRVRAGGADPFRRRVS